MTLAKSAAARTASVGAQVRQDPWVAQYVAGADVGGVDALNPKP